MQNKRETLRIKRHRAIRLKMSGTAETPRLAVHRSLKNISGQLVDDTVNKTILSMSTQDKEIKSKLKYAGNIKAAEVLGVELAKKAKENGVTKVVFDRAGYLYHGRVKAFADALRKGGLIF